MYAKRSSRLFNISLIWLVHENRDRILLEGEDLRSDDEGDEEEVFALKGMPEDSAEESGDEDSDQEHGQDEEDDTEELERLQAQLAKEKAKEKKAKGKKKQEAISSSEEESEEEDEGWGRNKAAYYSSNAAQIDSEDEEANEMEEQEAKRLQAKARDAMADDDFGLTDAMEALTEQQEFVTLCFLLLLANHPLESLVRTPLKLSPLKICLKGSTSFCVILKRQILKLWPLLVTGMILHIPLSRLSKRLPGMLPRN